MSANLEFILETCKGSDNVLNNNQIKKGFVCAIESILELSHRQKLNFKTEIMRLENS